MLTDYDRRLLTEFLGECWHESRDGRAVGKIKLSGGISIQTCYKCKAVMSDSYHVVNENRTFDTDADMVALFRKMVDEEELDNFLFWCSVTHFNFPPKIEKLFYKPERFCYLVAYKPERFCKLVANWWEERIKA